MENCNTSEKQANKSLERRRKHALSWREQTSTYVAFRLAQFNRCALRGFGENMFFIKSFGIFFLLSFGGGVLTYSLLALVMERLVGEPAVFGAWWGMILYHWHHPFQYIAVVAILYSLFAAIWATFWSDSSSGWRRWLEITFILILSLLTSCVCGGILWKLHDMQSGYFPENSKMWADFLWGASEGLTLGPLIVLLSFPLNLLALISGYLATHRVPKFLRSRIV